MVNTIDESVRGGDAILCQITLTTCLVDSSNVDSVGCQRDATKFAAERRRLLHGAHTAPAAIDRYLLPAWRSAANPPGRRCCCQSMGQTDGQTDGRPTVT